MPTFEVTTLTPQPAAAVRAEVPLAELPTVFDRAFRAVAGAVAAQGQHPSGPPFGFYPRMPTDTIAVAAGFPTSGPIAAAGDVEPIELPGGLVITAVHVGPYDTLEQTYGQLAEWAAANGYQLADQMWESYLSDPASEPDPATWQTQITWPVTPLGASEPGA